MLLEALRSRIQVLFKDRQGLPAHFAQHRLKRQRKEHRIKYNKHKHVKTLLMIHLIGSQKHFCSHKFSHQVLTCSELKTAKIYWNTKAWALTAKTPKIHELPRIGKSTATAFAVSLEEKMETGPLQKWQPAHQRVHQACPGSTAAGGTLLYHDIPLMGKILMTCSSVKMGITERWYHTG